MVILPVPWDVTVSFRDGAFEAPDAILYASKQVDLYYPGHKDAWKMGIAMEETPLDWVDLNKHYRKKATEVIGKLEKGVPIDDPSVKEWIEEINEQ